MATGTRVTGLRETVRELEKLGVEVEDLKAAFLEIATDVVEEARLLVPVRTGALKASIRPAKSKNKAVVRAGNAGRLAYARPQEARTAFLTRPANTNVEDRVRTLDRNLETLIRKHRLGA